MGSKVRSDAEKAEGSHKRLLGRGMSLSSHGMILSLIDGEQFGKSTFDSREKIRSQPQECRGKQLPRPWTRATIQRMGKKGPRWALSITVFTLVPMKMLTFLQFHPSTSGFQIPTELCSL